MYVDYSAQLVSIKTLFVSRDNMIWLNEFSAKFGIESKEDTHIIELVNLAIVLLDNPSGYMAHFFLKKLNCPETMIKINLLKIIRHCEFQTCPTTSVCPIRKFLHLTV